MCFSPCVVPLYSRAMTQVCKPESVKAPPNTAAASCWRLFHGPGEATGVEFSCRCDCVTSWWQLIKRSLGGTEGALGRQLDQACAGIKKQSGVLP